MIYPTQKPIVIPDDFQIKCAKKLESGQSPPLHIHQHREAIDAKIRLAEFRASMTGVIDEDLVNEIVQMKLDHDGLYEKWVKECP